MFSRPSFVFACAVAVVATFVVLSGQQERGASDVRAERAREHELTERRAALHHQLSESDVVAERLAAGELALAAAVRELEVINHSRLGPLRGTYTGVFPGREPSDHELLAYFVIGRVRRGARIDPERRCEALARLEGEYRELFSAAVPPE